MRGKRALEGIDADIRAHIERETQDNIERGLSPEEAHRQAMLAFGSVALAKEDTRAIWSWPWLEQASQDVRYAFRTWRKDRGFATVVILTLAIGIGATTAIYSVVDTILLRPLPFADSDRLVRVIENVPLRGGGIPSFQRGLGWQEFLEWRARTRTLSESVGISPSIAMVGTSDGTARLWGSATSATTFTLLGTRALLGRTLVAADEAHPDVVVLSFDTWRRLFHSAPDVVGTTVEFLSSVSAPRRLTVVGVLPAGFELPIGDGDFYTPFHFDAGSTRYASVTLVGRLRTGSTMEAAAEEAALIGTAVTKPPPVDAPAMSLPRFEVRRLKDQAVQELAPALRALLAAVAVLLTIVCANVANLLLARGTARQREMAVRFALGASRGRVIRQVLTECLVLATIGGALGAALGAAGIGLVKELASVDAPGIFRLSLGASILPRVHEVGINGKVFGIAFGIAALTSLAFGVLPALHLSRLNPRQSPLQAVGPRGGGTSRSASRIHAMLVVGQLAMATVLLVGAGLLIHSFGKLTAVDRGYDSSNVLAFQLVFPPDYPIARKADTIETILGRLRALPDVVAAGFTRHGMLIGEQITIGTFVPSGRTVDQMRASPVRPSLRPVSGGFLSAVGAHMLEGTDLNPSDAGSPGPIVISRSTARIFGPGRQIGRLVDWHVGDRIVPLQVVGVAEDLRNTTPDRKPFPEVFIDYRQVLKVQQQLGETPLWQNERALGLLSFSIRTRGDPASAAATVSRVVRAVDPKAGIDAILPLDRLVASSVARPRFYAVLLGVFAGVAGVLATHRHLWRAGLCRDPAHTGDRRAHGARGAARTSAEAGAAQGFDPFDPWRCTRTRRRGRRDAIAPGDVVRYHAARSEDVHRGCVRVGSRGDARVLPAGAPRDERRSDGGPAKRVARRDESTVVAKATV